MIDTKTNITQTIIDSLSTSGNKVSFMPDASVLDAVRFLEEKGIPNAKHEEYKYCNLEAVFRRDFKSISNQFSSPLGVVGHKLAGCINLVLVNGTYHAELSDKAEGITVSTLHEADKAILAKHLSRYADVNTDAFVAMNTAFCTSGLFIHIRGIAEKPIHILNVISATGISLVNPRQLIIADKSAEATLIESFISEGDAPAVFHNHLTEIFVDENAKIKSYRLQQEGSKVSQVNTTEAIVKRYGNYTTNTFTFGGAFVRNNLHVVLADDLCEAHLNGLFVTGGSQLVDNHTLVDHQKPNCESNELYKGIAKDKSTGIFNGKIFVRKDAQKTNAYQSSKNILLSDDATINTKPQLEIYADDVKCSHGTSTGKVDENALFYLKARGIGDSSARRLLLQAFAQELIEKVEVEVLQERILHLFEKAL